MSHLLALVKLWEHLHPQSIPIRQAPPSSRGMQASRNFESGETIIYLPSEAIVYGLEGDCRIDLKDLVILQAAGALREDKRIVRESKNMRLQKQTVIFAAHP